MKVHTLLQALLASAALSQEWDWTPEKLQNFNSSHKGTQNPEMVGLPRENWIRILSEPQFAAVVPINGFNISSNSWDAIDGWNVSLSFQPNVSTKEVQPGADPGLFDAVELRLDPPDSLVGSAIEQLSGNDTVDIREQSWEVCSTHYKMWRDAQVDRGDGTCSSQFSEDCLAALQRRTQYRGHYNCSQIAADAWPDECRASRPDSIEVYIDEQADQYASWDNITDDDVPWVRGSEMASLLSSPWPANVTRAGTGEFVLDRFDLVMIWWTRRGTDDEENVTEVSRSVACPKALLEVPGLWDDDAGDSDDDSGDEDDGSSAAHVLPAAMAGLVPLLAILFL